MYSLYEIAVYISTDTEKDPNTRFEKVIDYVRQQLQQSPDGLNVSRDISIGKIAKTICKYSPKYLVGEYESDVTPVIHTIHTCLFQQNRTKTDSNLKYKICGQLGHDEKNENGCMFFPNGSFVNKY